MNLDADAIPFPAYEELVTIPARDGYPLRATIFHPAHPNGSVVLIGSATAVPRSYYAGFAKYLSDRGHHAITVDYRGIGESAPTRLRGFQARMRDWGALDLAGVIDWIDAKLNPSRFLFVGHSVAGQLLGLTPNASRLDAAYLVGSQSGYWRHWDGAARAKIAAFVWAVLPTATSALGYFPSRLMGGGEDLPAGVAIEWASWGRHPDYLRGVCPEANDGYARLQMPVAFVSIEDDDFAPERAVDAISRWFGAPASRRIIRPRTIGVDKIGHFGFFRKQFASTLWKDAGDWLEGSFE